MSQEIALRGNCDVERDLLRNRAGARILSSPIMILYLLAMDLPKLEFVGTAAWFFFVVNLLKVPFSWSLGLINPNSLPLDLIVALAAIGGAVFGRQIIAHINQVLFERLLLLLTFLAAVKLLLS